MNMKNRALNTKYLSDVKRRERIKSLGYSSSIIQAFNLLDTHNPQSKTLSSGILLMDIAWQSSGIIPTEEELANAYYPIDCFFLGTVYQDDLLDSIDKNKPRKLVQDLGASTCMLMGNILYCEGLLALIEVKNDLIITQVIINSAQKLVKGIMDSENYRRDYIGKILPSKEFFNLWRYLTPNRTCIEIGGIFGKSKKHNHQNLLEIGSNISITRRIIKEISEMYGLRGSIEENLSRKPPPLPVSLGYESAIPSERIELIKAIHRLSKVKSLRDTEIDNHFQTLINVVAKYDSISAALNIHKDLIRETMNLISKIPNSEHREILTQLLGSEILS